MQLGWLQQLGQLRDVEVPFIGLILIIPARDPKQCKNEMQCICDHSMWALYVWPLYGSTLCVATLCGTILCEHSMCGHSMCALYVWPLYVSTLCVSTLCVSTLCVTTLCEHSMCDHSMRDHSMWPLYASTLCVTTLCEHPMREHSMWARTPKSTDVDTAKSTKTITKNEHQFLGRMWQNVEKYENYHANSTSVLGPGVAAPKTSKKHEFYCKKPVQEHCRTLKSTRITTKNEHGRSWAEKVRKFTDETRFRPFQEHRRTPKSTRITTKNEHRRSWEAGNHENLQTKASGAGLSHPKTTKIETTKIAMNSAHSPVRHLDLATRAFYYYRKNPKCYHTVWGKTRIQRSAVIGRFTGIGFLQRKCSYWSLHLLLS